MLCEQVRIRPAASWVAVRSAAASASAPAGSGASGLSGGADEDHVHVAGVVELAPAALAHGDHRQPGGGRARGQLGAGDGQRRLQGRGGEVGQFGRGLVDRDGAGQVPGRQVQQPPLVGGGQGRGQVPVPRPGRVGDRFRVVGLGAHRDQQIGPQLGGLRAAQRVRAAQHLPVIRVADQVIAERGARAEHRGEPVPQPGVSAQRGEQVTVEGHPGQRDQGQIRVGGRGERGQQVSVGALGIEGQVLTEQPFRAGCVSKSHPGQFPGRGCPSARTHICTVTAGCGVGFLRTGSPGAAGARVTGADTAARGLRQRPESGIGRRGQGGRGRAPRFRTGQKSGAGAVRRRPRQGGAPGGVGAHV